MSHEADAAAMLVERVRELVDAENERDPEKAGRILADEFVAITRMRGDEQGRDALLREIADPKNPNVRRSMGEDDFWVRQSERLAVVRSIVTTTDTTDPAAAPRRFRNVHVFESQQSQWRCLSWQVTELKDVAG